jgi:protein TonB
MLLFRPHEVSTSKGRSYKVTLSNQLKNKRARLFLRKYTVTLAAALAVSSTAAAPPAQNQVVERPDPNAAVMAEIENKMAAFSKKINPTLPRMIDEETRLDTSAAGPGKVFTYFYTLISHASSDFDAKEFSEAIAPDMKKDACSDKNVHRLLQDGVVINYVFRGNDGKEIARLATTFADCDARPLARAEGTAASSEEQIQRMEKEQENLLREITEQLQDMEDSPRKRKIKAVAEEIKRRIRAQQADRPQLFVTPNSKLTPAMRAYYERMSLRLMDCGTRHFPMRDGRKLHGKGIVQIRLDRHGQVIKTEIATSSNENLIDQQIPKIVAATAPFGDLPDQILADRADHYNSVSIVTAFSFERDDQPIADLPKEERCKWK